jgi:hypothetical protein
MDPPDKDSKNRSIRKDLVWKDTDQNVNKDFIDDVTKNKTGSAHIFTRKDFDTFQNDFQNLPANSPFLDEMLPGDRTKIIQEFKNSPDLEELYAYGANLSNIPAERVNGRNYGQMGTGPVFNIASRGYNRTPEKPPVAPVDEVLTVPAEVKMQSNPPALELERGSNRKNFTGKTVLTGSGSYKGNGGFDYKRNKPAKGSITNRVKPKS